MLVRWSNKYLISVFIFCLKVRFTFYKYMNTVKSELRLDVVDIYKQKDLSEYRGTLRLTVDNGTDNPDEFYEMTVTLPKV